MILNVIKAMKSNCCTHILSKFTPIVHKITQMMCKLLRKYKRNRFVSEKKITTPVKNFAAVATNLMYGDTFTWPGLQKSCNSELENMENKANTENIKKMT